jgi:hypothetical protein
VRSVEQDAPQLRRDHARGSHVWGWTALFFQNRCSSASAEGAGKPHRATEPACHVESPFEYSPSGQLWLLQWHLAIRWISLTGTLAPVDRFSADLPDSRTAGRHRRRSAAVVRGGSDEGAAAGLYPCPQSGSHGSWHACAGARVQSGCSGASRRSSRPDSKIGSTGLPRLPRPGPVIHFTMRLHASGDAMIGRETRRLLRHYSGVRAETLATLPNI